MECSCHINPPCNYCTELIECPACGDFVHPKEDDRIFDDLECEKCYNKIVELPKGVTK